MRAEDLPLPPVPKLPKVSVERLEAQRDSICTALVQSFSIMHEKESHTPCLAFRIETLAAALCSSAIRLACWLWLQDITESLCCMLHAELYVM